jgi:hypothetical protein
MPSARKEEQRYILQHVWKTGGSEFCYLLRANQWSTPPSNNCLLDVENGWPMQDYDMIANERPALIEEGTGKVKVDFINATNQELEVHNVKWITILRHPYSRSLSHYYHMLAVNQSKDFTLPKFLTQHGPFPPYHFSRYIPNQQARWHCGSWECHYPYFSPQFLAKAFSNLQQMHVILILEEMKDPDSCTRWQMRHVLNLTQVEVLDDLRFKKPNSTDAHNLTELLFRRPFTSWYKDIRPQLITPLRDNLTSSSSAWGNESSSIMAALALYNEMDLQLYGYARKLCSERAADIQRNLMMRQTNGFPTPQRVHDTLSHLQSLASITSDGADAMTHFPNHLLQRPQSLITVIFLVTLTVGFVRRRQVNQISKRCFGGKRHPILLPLQKRDN